MQLTDLDTLIPQYAANKSEMENYKKICDDENKRIKEIMKNFAIQKFESGNWRATYSVETRETMNEEMLLAILKEHGYTEGIVKTKEYVDMDALEKAIYDFVIPKSVLMAMNSAKEKKEIVKLRVSKIGGKK